MPCCDGIDVQEFTREANGLSPLARYRVMCYRRAGPPHPPATTRAGGAVIHMGMTVLESLKYGTDERKEVFTRAHRERV
jgi:hypothetical protein